MTEQEFYSLDRIITYLEQTDEDNWCTDYVRTKDGKNCLFGHLFDLGGSKLMNWFDGVIATSYMVYLVNDGKNDNYRQETPKQRCIAYLNDLKRGDAKTVYQLMEEYS